MANRVAPTSRRVELALGGSIVKVLRDMGATAIYTPSELRAATSANRAVGPSSVIVGYGTSDYVTETIDLEDYPATFTGLPTRGVRGPLPEGRMAATFNGSSQYLTGSSYVSAAKTTVTTWSPLASRMRPVTVVVLFKGGNAGEPLVTRDPGTDLYGAYGLFTDDWRGLGTTQGDHSGTPTFENTSDPSNWVLLCATASHSAFGDTKVWKNTTELAYTGSWTTSNRYPEADRGTLYIGRNASGTDFFTGTIALVALLPSRALTQADVEQIYAATQWTDVTADVAGWAEIGCEYGLPGDRPDDVLARTGDLSLTLKNGETNAARTIGYYSPGHADCRSGFKVGIPIRFSLGYYDRTFYKFRGRVDAIEPTAGLYGARETRLRAVDWMEEPATSPLPKLGTETNLRYDEALQTILDAMAQPPAFVDLAQGRDEFPYVFDAARSSNSPSLSEIARVVRSERAYLYPVGDEDGGGTLKGEHRHSRALDDTIGATLDGSMYELTAGRSRRDIVTAVTVTIHPRRIDTAATTVLFALDADVVPRLGPGETIEWRAGYRDPDSPIARIGGTNIVTPVASTDYVMNSAEDGSGTDVTASMVVEFTHAGVFGVFRITNPTNADVYVRTLQIRGKGLYQYADLLCRSESAEGLVEYGENHVALDMAYQTDPQVGQGVADWVQATWSQETTGVSRLSFLANRSDALLLAALTVEPGTAVCISEAATGVDFDDDIANYYVHRVRYALTEGDILRVTWTLAPADRERFWILDEPGRSELDETTRLAYA